MSTDPRAARAEAKAAEARAKALRPWYRKKRWWLGGFVLIFVVILIAVIASAGKTISNDENTVHTAIYSLSGNGTADATYETATNGTVGSSQDTNVTLPWTKTVTGKGLFSVFEIEGTLTSNGTLTCKLTIDGKLVSTNTAHGLGASADCTGTKS